MGKKYIIELNPDCVEGEYLRIPARIAGEEQWLVTKAALTPYTAPDLERVRKEAYRQGYDTGYGTKVNEFYEQGLVDAWEAARKIACDEGIDMNTLCTIFRRGSSVSIIRDYSASEVIAKIKEYEDSKQEIKVGDEVLVDDDIKGVVLDIDESIIHVFDENGLVMAGDRELMVKTGRTFPEIAAVLEKMRGEQE